MAKMTKEELNSMIAEQVKAAVASALETKAAPPAAHEEGDGSNASGTKGAPAAAAVERKYAGIYMATGSPEADPNPTKQEKGIGWARAIKCIAQSQGDPGRALHIAQKMYAQDDVLHRELKALSATAPSDGGYLIPEIYAADVIELLYAQCVVNQLGATVVPMETGNLTIPKLKSGASSSYVGELRSTKATKQGFGNVKMSAKKQMTKVLISNDLLRSASYRADQIIRDDALRAMALGRDRAALMGKGTTFESKGLLNYNVTKVALDAEPDTSTTGAMLAELIKANVNTNKLGWAFNGAVWGALYNVVDASGRYVYRDGLDKGQLNGHAIGLSNQLPIGTDANGKCSIILGNWSDFLVGEQLAMEAEMFREGSAKDENDEIISAIDNDCSILRLISLHDFALRHEESFVVGTGLQTK